MMMKMLQAVEQVSLGKVSQLEETTKRKICNSCCG